MHVSRLALSVAVLAYQQTAAQLRRIGSPTLPTPPRMRSGRDKVTQAMLTVAANRGRLTRRGRCGYGLTPVTIKPERQALYLNASARSTDTIITIAA